MSPILAIAFFAIGGGIAAFMAWERHDMARAQIIGALKRLRATDVVIAFDWGNFDRDTFTYDVEFIARDGQRHRDRCKVSTRRGAGEPLYWERGLPRVP